MQRVNSYFQLAHALDDASDHNTSLETFTKELKVKNAHLRQLNGLIEEKLKENEDLKGLRKRLGWAYVIVCGFMNI